MIHNCCSSLCNLWTAVCQACLSITISLSLLKLMFIESMMPSNHLIPCCPLLLPPLIFPSIRVFSHESALHIAWPKYWSFSFSISLSVQSLSHVQLFVTPWTTALQASLSITNSQNLLKLMSIELVMPSNHLILHHPLLLLPSIFPRRNPSPAFLLFTYSFFSESLLCIRWPSYAASDSALVLPVNIQVGFLLGLTGWILLSKGLSRVFSSTTV